MLGIEFPADFPIDHYSMKPEGTPPREALFPAAVLNDVGRIVRVIDLWDVLERLVLGDVE